VSPKISDSYRHLDFNSVGKYHATNACCICRPS
jgi:hypothetical protein